MIPKRARRSEQLLLSEIMGHAQALQMAQRGLGLGQLFALIRRQLGMSQRALSRRSGVAQSTISRLEAGHAEASTETLRRLADALSCDLVMTALPREGFEAIRRRQATVKAKRKIGYLEGTMSLEEQAPDREFLDALLEDEISRLLLGPGSKLWDDET